MPGLPVLTLPLGTFGERRHEHLRGRRGLYGTLDPRGWLDNHNAFAIPRRDEARETIARFCDDACSSRYRIGAMYVFFAALDDATMFRLSR